MKIDFMIFLIGLLPGCRFKNALLRWLAGWSIHPTARVGPCILRRVSMVELGPNAQIAGGSIYQNLRLLRLAEHAAIGRWNTVTGPREFFESDAVGIGSFLCLGKHARVSLRHYLSCAGGIRVGAFTSIGGVRSTIFSHQVDFQEATQIRRGVEIGSYSLITSDCRLAPGAKVPDRCVIGMGSTVIGSLKDSGWLYSGNPAKAIRELSAESGYFKRSHGFIEIEKKMRSAGPCGVQPL